MVNEDELPSARGPGLLDDGATDRLKRAGSSLLGIDLSHSEVEDVDEITTVNRTRVLMCLDTSSSGHHRSWRQLSQS